MRRVLFKGFPLGEGGWMLKASLWILITRMLSDILINRPDHVVQIVQHVR